MESICKMASCNPNIELQEESIRKGLLSLSKTRWIFTYQILKGYWIRK